MPTMRELIESRIQAHPRGEEPHTGFAMPRWFEAGYSFTSQAVEIARDDYGCIAYADDECVLYVTPSAGDFLRGRDPVYYQVRCMDHRKVGRLNGASNEELWRRIGAGQVPLW